jgi:hypothetical protein
MRSIASLVLRTRDGEGGDRTYADRATTPEVRFERCRSSGSLTRRSLASGVSSCAHLRTGQSILLESNQESPHLIDRPRFHRLRGRSTPSNGSWVVRPRGVVVGKTFDSTPKTSEGGEQCHSMAGLLICELSTNRAVSTAPGIGGIGR